MGTRELIILILGLAVVVVMLRGLYLALQARRGQLRLAIDKNIPKDVDLNALEMAELPNGGARVVGHSLEMVNRQNRRVEKAAALDLGGSAAKAGPIPVLMDTVALGEVRMHAMPPRAELEDDEFEDDFEDDIDDEDEDDEFDDDEDFDEDLDKELVEIEEEEDLDTFEEEDDFGDEDDDELDKELDEEEDFDPDADEEAEDEFEEIDEEEDEDFLDQPGADELVDDDDEYTVNVAGRSEPVIQDSGENDGEFEKEFGSIAMTAGERIGARTLSPTAPTPPIEANLKASARAEQASLFNDNDQAEPAPKRASLLERFGERARSRSGKSEQSGIAPKMQKRREVKPAPTQDVRSVREAREQKEVRPIEPSEVLVINVMSREGEVFHGDDLLQALITTGLKFGEMNIFHHRQHNASNGAVVFSVANILNPGTFDLNRMGEFNTRGISMFLSMPAFINNLEAFELMLKTAQQIRGALNGELKDDHRNVMTAQTIEHYRQRVRDYELRRLKAIQA